MFNFGGKGLGRISRNISSLAHSPEKSGCHGLISELAVRLLVSQMALCGVDPQKQLRDPLSREARLNINDRAIAQHFTMRSVMQFEIGPKPKRRSTMWHFSHTPVLKKPDKDKGRLLRYVLLFTESIDSYKRYRYNVLAARSVGADGTLKVIKGELGVIRG
jgi:hypothetical protein